MRNRLIASIAALSAAAMAVVLGPQPLRAQAPAARGTTARAADGHPDLSGMYDVATMTPLRRPTEFGTRRALTKAEAAEIAALIRLAEDLLGKEQL